MAEELKYSVNIDFSKAKAEWESFVKGMQRQSKEIAKALEGISKQFESGQLPLGFRELTAPFKQAAEELQNLSKQFQSLGATMRQQAGNVSATGSAFEKFVYQLKNTFSISELLRASLTTLGVGFGAYGIVQGVRVTAEAVSEFDRHMREIWTLLDSTEAEFKSFENQVLELSKQIPLSTTELAKGIYWALSAGIPKENVLELVTEASKAALAGVTSLKTTVDVITTVMNSYGYAASKVTEINDVLFRGTAIAKTTFEELVTSIGPILPVAAQLGVTIEEVVAALGTLSNMGISTARAATYINQALVRILSPTREASETARQLGIQFDSTAIKAMGFTKYLQYLKETVGNNEEALANLFENVRAMRAIFSLVSDQGLRMFTNMLGEVKNSAGATQEAFQKMNNALSYEWQRLKNIISSTFKSEGFREGLADVLRGLNNMAEAVFQTGNKVQGLKNILETSYNAIEQYRMASSQLASTYDRVNSIQSYLQRSTEDLKKSYENIVNAFNKYNDAVATSYLSKHGFVQLAGDEKKIVDDLSKLYPQLAEAIDKVGDSYRINKDKLLEFMKTQVSNMQLQLDYIKMNIDYYRAEAEHWQKQREEYNNQIKQVEGNIKVLEKLKSAYENMGVNIANTLREKISATMKETGAKSVGELFGKEYWSAIAGGATVGVPMSTAQAKAANVYFETQQKIEKLQREVYEALINGMIDNWYSTAKIATEQMPENIRSSVETLLNEMRQMYNKTANMPAEQAWKTFRGDFIKFIEKNKVVLEQLPEEVSQPLLLYYSSVLKDYSNLQSIMEAIVAGYNPVQKVISDIGTRIDEMGYQHKQLESGVQQMDLKAKQANIELEGYSRIYGNLSNQIESLRNKVNEIASKSTEVLEAEAVLDSLSRASEQVMEDTASLFEGISKTTRAQIEDIKEQGLAAIKFANGLTLEDLAKTFGDTATSLYNRITEQLQKLETIDISRLSGELKQKYEEQKRTLQQAKANLEVIVNILNIKDLLEQYKIDKATFDVFDITELSTSLLKNFGVNLADVIESVAGGAKSVQLTLNDVRDKIATKISETGLVNQKTAADIAQRVAAALLEFVNKQTADYSTEIKKSIQQATQSTTFLEKITSLTDLLKQVQSAENLSAILTPIFGKQFADVISQEVLPELVNNVNKSLQEAIIEAAQSGIDVPALLKDSSAAEYAANIASRLRTTYDEQVQNFQTQIKLKYQQIFGKELENITQGLNELIVRSDTDKELYLWLQKLNKLAQSIIDVGMTIKMLGGEVDVVKDLGENVTGLLNALRDVGADMGKFRTELNNWKVAADLFTSSDLWENLDLIDQLRNKLDQLINESIRPLRTNLLGMYYDVATDDKAFSRYADTLSELGIKSAKDLETSVKNALELEGASEQVRTNVLNITNAVSSLATRFAEITEELPQNVSAMDILFGRRGDIQAFTSTISQISSQIKEIKNIQSQLIQSRDNFKIILQQMPTEVQTRLQALVDIINQFIFKYDEGIKNLEKSKTQLETQYSNIINDIFNYVQKSFERVQTAIQSGDYLTLGNILYELTKVDINAIPLKAEVQGKTGLQIREQLKETIDLVERELDNFKQSVQDYVSNIRNRVSIADLVRQFIITGDPQKLLSEIDNFLKVPQMHMIEQIAQYAQDPQLKDAFSRLAQDIKSRLIDLRETIVRDVVGFALSGVPSDDILKSSAHLAQLEYLVRQMINERRKLDLSADELEQLLIQISEKRASLFEDMAKQEQENREKVLQERLNSIKALVQTTLTALHHTADISADEAKQKYDELYSYLISQMEQLSKEYPEFFESISSTFEKLFDLTETEQASRLKDISKAWLEGITQQVQYMNSLAQGGIDNYKQLLDLFITMSEELDTFKSKLQITGLIDEYKDQITRIEEEMRNLLKLDLSKAFGVYDIVDSLKITAQLMDLIADRAEELTKFGVDLNTLLEPLKESLSNLFQTLPNFNFGQAFQETVFKPLADALANSLLQAWIEASKDIEEPAEKMSDLIVFAADYFKNNLSLVAGYAAASLLTASDSIVNSLSRLGIIGTDIANAILEGVEGAKIGWYIGQQITKALSNITWLQPVLATTGGILGFIFGWIFNALAEQQRKAQELQQKIQQTTERLKSSFASAVTSAFDEVDLESFRNNVRKSLMQSIRDAFIEALTEKIIAQQVAALAAMFVGPQGELRIPSPEEIQSARSMIEQVAKVAEKWYEVIRQMFPELYSTSSEWSASSAMRTITEETANRLVGLFTTLTTYVYQIKKVIVDGETAVKVIVVNPSGSEVLRSRGVI